MKNRSIVLLLLSAVVALPLTSLWAFPEPLIVSDAWEYKFTYDAPRPIAVRNIDGEFVWYWYMTYTVQNNTGRERMFAPEFQVATDEGDIVTANRRIPPTVFNAIKTRLGNDLLEGPVEVNGRFLVGDDNIKDSLIIWPAPTKPVGRMTIFVAGMSGETQRLTHGRSLVVTNKKKGEVTYQGPLVTESHRHSLPRGVGRKMNQVDRYIDELKEIKTPEHEEEGSQGSTIKITTSADAWTITYDDNDHQLVVTQKKNGYDMVLRKQVMIDYELPGKPSTPQKQNLVSRGKSWVIR